MMTPTLRSIDNRSPFRITFSRIAFSLPLRGPQKISPPLSYPLTIYPQHLIDSYFIPRDDAPHSLLYLARLSVTGLRAREMKRTFPNSSHSFSTHLCFDSTPFSVLHSTSFSSQSFLTPSSSLYPLSYNILLTLPLHLERCPQYCLRC